MASVHVCVHLAKLKPACSYFNKLAVAKLHDICAIIKLTRVL